MTAAVRISDDIVWAGLFGYSRVVRIGNIVEVAGTAASDNQGNVQGVGDAAEQTRFIIRKIEAFLKKADASLSDVVRTRIFVTDMSLSDEVGRAHGEFFSDIRPVCSMVEVSALIAPTMLVEIEATAIISSESP